MRNYSERARISYNLHVPPKTLLLGVGNPILSDDQAGLLVAELVKVILEGKGEMLPKWLSIETAERGGLEFTERLSGFERAIIVDTLKTDGERIGQTYELTEDDFEKTEHLTSYHGINFFTAVELGRRLGLKMPSEIKVFAIEISENQIISEQIHPEVMRAVKELSKRLVLMLLRDTLELVPDSHE